MPFRANEAFSPPPLPPSFNFDEPQLLKKLNRASTELAELKGYSTAMANPLLLTSPFVIQESVASSNIENINTTVVEFMEGQLFPEAEQRTPDKEVSRYREALLWAAESRGAVALSTRLITGIQTRLMDNKLEGFRRQQNKIENTRTREVIYTPPIASEIPHLMSEWETFANETDEDIHPLIRTALCHYQFEAIHPFWDGNGRTGRILMVIQLMEYGLLHNPILFLSGYLNKNRAAYYESLRKVTTEGDWAGYLSFMIDAFIAQAGETKMTLFKIMALHEEFKETLKADHKSIYSAELVDHLFTQPITTPVRMSEAIGTHYATASRHLKALAEAGLLSHRKMGKFQLYANARLVKLLQG